MTTPLTIQDEVRRFILERLPVRGHFVRLQSAWSALREHRDYPGPVRELLGQAVSASVLLAATLKFRGTLTLQLQGNGAARLLVAQCTDDFGVRALVRTEDEDFGNGSLTPELFRQLVGTDGRLAVTIESAERDARYQGIVPLTGATLAECLEAYFATSEQLPTRVRLAADASHAAGLLIQRLPIAEGSPDEETGLAAWADAERGILTLQAEELLAAPLDEMLLRHFREHDLRVFSGAPVRFECRCAPARVANVLRALGEAELRDVLAEQGAIVVTCDFCNRPYRFDAVDVGGLFAPGGSPEVSRSIQ